MNVLRAAIGILGLALLGLVIWAAVSVQDLHGTFFDQVAVLTTLPWGIAHWPTSTLVSSCLRRSCS